MLTGALVATIIYYIAVGMVYANIIARERSDTVYSAERYEGEPTEWYLPDELGIIDIEDYGAKDPTWVHVVVPLKSDPGNLTTWKPIFKYEKNGRFYKILELHVTPALSIETQWMILLSPIAVWGVIIVWAYRKENNSAEYSYWAGLPIDSFDIHKHSFSFSS